MTATADTNPLREALEKICRVGKWTGTDGLEYSSTEGRIAEAALASEPVVGTVSITDAMLDAHMRATGDWCEPFTAERESGVAIACDISREDPDGFNAESRATLRKGYAAALSAPPAPAAEDIGREAEELIANSRPAPAGREDLAIKAKQTAFNILAEHPDCLRDDVPLQDLIDDLAEALCIYAEPRPALSPQDGRASNYESRHPTETMVLHPLSDIRDLDEVVHELGIQDSSTTPAEAVRELNAEIERLRATPPAPGAADRAEWQSIETAPRDGTPMLFCHWENPEQDVLPIMSGFWSRLSEGWYAELSGQKMRPTHWRPLPTPPTLPRADRSATSEGK